MRWWFVIFVFSSLVIFACAKDPEPSLEQEISQDEILTDYFNYKIDGTEFSILNIPQKGDFKKTLGAEEEAWTFSLGRKKFTLKFWGKRLGNYGQEIEKHSGFIKDYQGPGVYILEGNVNSCQFYSYGISFYSSHQPDGSFIEIIEDFEGWITGVFTYTSFNINDKSDFKSISGEFRLQKILKSD